MLASVQTITKIEPHTNADTLSIATVMGWRVIIKTGEFQEGDNIIYVETDTIMPAKKEYEFLERVNFRVKPIKLRGLFSEGLIIPNTAVLPVGTDVTDLIGVKKYEKAVPDDGESMGSFPTSLCSKTDEERIQGNVYLLGRLREKDFYITTKHDGSSVTFGKLNGEFYVCSRNLRKLTDGNSGFAKMFHKYNVGDHLEEGETIQLELCGPGIQGNSEGLKEIDVRMFSHWKNRERQPYPFTKWENVVPQAELLYDSHKDSGVELTVDSLEKFAEPLKYKGTQKQIEGIVIRSFDNQISFKVINKAYASKE